MCKMEDHTGYSLGEVDIKKEVDCDLEVKIEVPPIQTLARLQCHVCYKIMGHRSSLYKHLKYVHKIEPAQRLPISCKEKDCFQSFTFIDPFRRHLAEQHGFNIVVEKYVFQSMTDFFSWKKMTEEEENLKFIVSTGPRVSKGGKTHYFRCQKNGAYRPELKKRLQSDKHETVYNVSTTHCISSMFVFEEPECVTVEFCRTHYGHDVNKKAYTESYVKPYSKTLLNGNANYEIIDSSKKLNEILSEKDKAALFNILRENEHLLEKTEEIFYENEQDVVLKIPCSLLKVILEEVQSGDEPDGVKGLYCSESFETLDGLSNEISGLIDSDEATVEKLDEEETDNENSTILKSLGNGIFLDPASNKRLKLDSLIKKSWCKDRRLSTDSTAHHDSRSKDREKGNKMLMKEYLNEHDEKVYVFEVKEEESVVQKREKILSQLQKILIMINEENDMEVLDEIQNHLSKYATPE